jgi:ABC-type Fe3+/spermidine/putrescine transport system ATPase subunit
MISFVREAFDRIDKNIENVAYTLGASPFQVFYKLTFPLSIWGVLKGLVMALSKSLGEIGATLILAGGLTSSTGTMSVLIYFATQKGEMDIETRQKIKTELKELQKKLHITMVYITHDQLETLEMADRLGILNNGKIEQFGNPDEVFYKPKTPFVAQFLNTENILNGKITHKVGNEVTIQVNAVILKTYTHLELSEGEPVIVCIRPGAIHLSTYHIPQGKNVFIGTIESIHPIGRDLEIRVLIILGEILKIRMSRIVAKELKLTHGMSVNLSIDEVFIHLIPAH